MSRVIAVIASGVALSACSPGFMQRIPSWPSLPKLDSGSFFGPQQVTIKVESSPAGAVATSPSGGMSCRTPCSLVVKTTGDFVVNVALAGYEPQTVPVSVLPPEDPRFTSEGSPRGSRLDPEQVFAELKPIPPAPRTGTHKRK